MDMETFNAIIVGSGQAGTPLAYALAGAGQRTALIERGRVGGTCVVTGCTPSKTMIASARVAHLARRAADYGVGTGPVTIDMKVVRERKRAVVDSFNRSSREGLEETDNLSLVRGTARFTGPHSLEVESGNGGRGRRLQADRIFLDVGGRPAIPPIDGLEETGFLDSTSAMELDTVPTHLVILGGGAIGLEFGQMFGRFGAAVTVIERASQLLPDEDEDIAQAMRGIMEDAGIAVFTNTEATQVDAADGGVRISLRGPGVPGSVTASHLLVAVGRTPNSDSLALENAGLETDAKGFIPVDEHCRTAVDGIWALGNVTGSPPFTHIAYDDYRVAAADVLGNGSGRTRERLLPYTIFTDPELGRIGLSERDATAKGRRFRVGKLPVHEVSRAIETDETQGLLKCLVEDGTDRILGAALLAPRGGELMAVLEVAMMGGLPFTALRDGVIAHPTFSESLQNLFSSLEDK